MNKIFAMVASEILNQYLIFNALGVILKRDFNTVYNRKLMTY